MDVLFCIGHLVQPRRVSEVFYQGQWRGFLVGFCYYDNRWVSAVLQCSGYRANFPFVFWSFSCISTKAVKTRKQLQLSSYRYTDATWAIVWMPWGLSRNCNYFTFSTMSQQSVTMSIAFSAIRDFADLKSQLLTKKCYNLDPILPPFYLCLSLLITEFEFKSTIGRIRKE